MVEKVTRQSEDYQWRCEGPEDCNEHRRRASLNHAEPHIEAEEQDDSDDAALLRRIFIGQFEVIPHPRPILNSKEAFNSAGLGLAEKLPAQEADLFTGDLRCEYHI